MARHEAYPVRFNEEHTRFQFQSIGKRGIFEKVVLLMPVSANWYNLSLLDYNPLTQEFSDISVTDNGDMPEVIATVIAIIQKFLDLNPGHKIYFKGSTPPRTRLYQIAISKVYNPNSSDLLIEGYKDDQWIRFEPDNRFKGFLVTKKF